MEVWKDDSDNAKPQVSPRTVAPTTAEQRLSQQDCQKLAHFRWFLFKQGVHLVTFPAMPQSALRSQALRYAEVIKFQFTALPL